MKVTKIKEQYQRHNQSIYGYKNIVDSVALLYQENSKLTPITSRLQGERIASFFNPYLRERSTLPYKIYPKDKTYSFSDFINLSISENQDDFMNVIKGRKSIRNYVKNYKVSLYELSQILHYSYGINRVENLENGDSVMSYRFVPSAGGLYPLEIYVVLFNSHLERGLYHYNVKNNNLSLLKNGNFLNHIKNIVNAEPYINADTSCGVVLISSVIERQMIKYGERSYRFMLQEVGHVSQMISLMCEKVDMGSCIAGGFIDEEINDFLGIDGVFENIQNVIFFGKK